MTDIDITFVEVEPDVVLVAQLPEIPSGGGGGGIVSVNGDVGPNVVLTAAEVGAADAVHTHDAGAVVSGTFAVGRIPTGTTGSTVALGNHLHTGVYDPAGSAATAQANAIATAASDATTKANTAQSTAIATAAADATAKADTAEADAISTAAVDATTKANAAQAAAISTASTDATTKANAALASANTYTDTQNNNDVHLTGDQTVDGIKTFSSPPIVPTPVAGTDAANKDYVLANGGGTDFWSYWQGVYNAGTTYLQDQIVRSVNGKGMYRCKVASSLGVAPPAFIPGVNQTFYRPQVPASHDSDTTSLTIGFRFTPLVDGQVNGVWFYKGTSNSGTHVARLWNDTTSTLLGGPTNFTGETASGWQYQAFPAPIAVTAGTIYVVGVDCTNGNYEFHSAFFAAGSQIRGQVNGLMGLFTTTTGNKPNTPFNNNYYSADVDFTTATPSPDNWEIMVLAS